MKKFFIILTSIASILCTQSYASQTNETNVFKVDNCKPVYDDEGDFDFCDDNSQKLYKDIVSKSNINFYNNFILGQITIAGKQDNFKTRYFVAIEPKLKKVMVVPYAVEGLNLNDLKLFFKKNDNKFCFLDTNKNEENTQFNTHYSYQNSRFGDVKTCVTLNNDGFEF